MTEELKTPPHSRESEQNVLGALMMDNRTFDDVADVITEKDFYNSDHRKIYAAIMAMSNAGQPFDAITISEWLERKKELENVGGLSYLGTLQKNTASARNAIAYAKLVRNYSIERQMITTGNDIAVTAYGKGTTQEKLDHAQAALMSLIDSTARHVEIENTNEVLAKVIDQIDHAHQRNGEITGLATGFTDLDNKTAGLHDGELIIVAARPSMGKTTFATNIARNAAMTGNAVMIFSIEMPSDQLIMREVAAVGGIELGKLRTGKLNEDDWPRLTSAAGKLSDTRIIIDSSPGIGLLEMKARARREKRKHDLKLIVVDYLQLMRSEGRTREEEVASLSRGLKQLARELSVPVIVLSQLNRSLESRPDKRPRLSDLRDSGSIEQDADVVLFIYRDEVYDEESERAGIAEIIIGKQRNGSLGMVPLTFRGDVCRFDNFIGELPKRIHNKKPSGFSYRGQDNNRGLDQ